MEPTDPWELAHSAAERSGVRLVPLASVEDAARVHAVVDRVWGSQVLPRELLRAFQHAGGTVLGADEEGHLVGFVLGFLGWNEGLHLHSHMLAVLPEQQSRGVGFALKLAQRAKCLEEGVDEVRWTFDPLVARNAWFNLVKLGAVATRLLPAQYGEMADRLNRGDRSDRFEIRWRLESGRTDRALAGSSFTPAQGPIVLRAAGDPSAPEPDLTGLVPEPGAVVQIPRDHFALRQTNAALGRRWRDAAAAAFDRCFEAGLHATWFSREGCYVFAPTEEKR